MPENLRQFFGKHGGAHSENDEQRGVEDADKTDMRKKYPAAADTSATAPAMTKVRYAYCSASPRSAKNMRARTTAPPTRKETASPAATMMLTVFPDSLISPSGSEENFA